MSEIVIDEDVFYTRLKLFYNGWKVSRSCGANAAVLFSVLTYVCIACLHAESRACEILLNKALWQQEEEGWGVEKRPSAVLIVVGSKSDEIRYRKSTALQMWLFGYELPGQTWFASPIAACSASFRDGAIVKCSRLLFQLFCALEQIPSWLLRTRKCMCSPATRKVCLRSRGIKAQALLRTLAQTVCSTRCLTGKSVLCSGAAATVG